LPRNRNRPRLLKLQSRLPRNRPNPPGRASLFDVPAQEAIPAPVPDEEEEIPPQADGEDVDSDEDDFDEAA
jgi:hypothetical protein